MLDGIDDQLIEDHPAWNGSIQIQTQILPRYGDPDLPRIVKIEFGQGLNQVVDVLDHVDLCKISVLIDHLMHKRHRLNAALIGG